MFRRTALAVLVCLVIAGGAFSLPLVAQQPASPQTELLAEVKLLRQAIESLAGTNARVQIVFGRLQLQETRTTNASRRLDQAREALTSMTRSISEMSDVVKDHEAVANDARRRPEDAEQARANAVVIKRQIDRMEIDRARLAGDETEAASALNQEQGRWSDLNRQLEELERTLTKGQRQ